MALLKFETSGHALGVRGDMERSLRIMPLLLVAMPFAPSSDALVTTSKALVTNSFLLLLVRHLLLIAFCYY